MENSGALAVILAFCISIYAILSSVVGRLKRRPFLIISGERAVYAVWFLITCATGILVYNFFISNFSFAYVASHSNRDMQGLYKMAALWGGQEGSLLFWSFLLSTYAAMVVFTNRRRHRELMPYVVAIISTVQTFFLTLNAFVVSPFQMLAVDKVITSVPDGMGLNPTLQYPAMAIHPPMLYLGYVGMTIPFAFAMAWLLTKQPGEAWIHTTRRWSLVTWLFQSCGVVLGAALGLSRSRMGRLLGLGPGGKRFVPALAQQHCLSPLRHDAGEEGHDEGLEHRAGVEFVFSLHLRHVSDPLRSRQFRPRLRAIAYREIFRRLPFHRHRPHHLRDPRPVAVP